MLICTSCGREHWLQDLCFECRSCGSCLSLKDDPIFDPTQVDRSNQSVWRYHHAFPFGKDFSPCSLGEGGTPLLEVPVKEQLVHFKLEQLNPTGSFKDRGSSLLITVLASIGVNQAIEDSTGNAGASFAAYCARAGIRGMVFVPELAPAQKVKQIEVYGAEVVRIGGPRSKVTEAAKNSARKGLIYASHVYNPIGLAGIATAAFEIVEQMKSAPEVVVCPLGQGTLLLGLYRGFRSLQRGGLLRTLPRLVGVQAQVCAPLWKDFTGNQSAIECSTERTTLADGIRIDNPVRRQEILLALHESHGRVLAVSEESILRGSAELARRGLYVEYTSAVVWPALEHLLAEGHSGPIATVLTGNGLKMSPCAETS